MPVPVRQARTRGVALGGFMGTGKSTVGPRLAQHLQLPFLDLDALITHQQGGRPPARIFAEQGEAAFRILETDAIRELIARPEPLVLSLGGGTLHTPGNLALLRDAFDVVVLCASLETIRDRLSADPVGAAGRPLWPVLADRYTARLPGYRAAGPNLWVDGCSPEAVVESILALWSADGERVTEQEERR